MADQPLPILPFRDRIVEGLGAGSLILSAPTGSGKSTQTPRFLFGRFPGRVLVLEPRRLAARSLAGRVAEEERTALGAAVGYQVRFDNKAGKDTKVVFQTYGVFIQRLLKDPGLPGVGVVLLDEFHERTLECDLSLAWLRALQKKKRPDIRFAVMSATLDAEDLAQYLPNAARVDVPGRLYPVDVRHQPGDDALRALQSLAQEGLDGSVLVFMPGMGEIRHAMNVLGPFCRAQGLALQSLHGSMELSEQQQVLNPPQKGNRVIVATNVAETGLTIPGVTMVIDGGRHRVAAYSPSRDINSLYLSRISLANAQQRAGRAGRTAPGRCVRLWSKNEELGFPDSLLPEVSRLELSSLFLQAASLPEPVEWLTPPEPAAWSKARASLESLAAVDRAGKITAKGRALLRYPAPPRLAAVLSAARALGDQEFEYACAMAAVFEGAGDRKLGASADLASLATDLLHGSRDEVPWEAKEIFRQLKRLGEESRGEPEGTLERVWLQAFISRLGAREGEGSFYRLADGRGVTLPSVKDPPSLILALDIRERAGGGQARQVGVSLFLPIALETVQGLFPEECAWEKSEEFDARQKRVIKEDRLMFRGLVLDRRASAPAKADRKAAAELWAEQYASGELTHPGFDAKVQQLVVRIKLARTLYPAMGFPGLSEDDWRLIYGEVCAGRNSLKDIERVPLAPHIAAYIGSGPAAFLDRMLPVSRKLPSGRTARFTYFESRPAELAARLGDFVKMSGTLSLCEDRLKVVFDILAPNQRTVQKTDDLSSFWKNTYPTVKRELQRRYPRHPWP